MDLKDFILDYKVNDKIVVDLFDYYDMYIKHLDKRFENYSYHASDLVLCFFKDHDDVNPSMGYMRDKKHKGGKVCHCFGCGRTADVIRLHQILRKTYENTELTERESCTEIANMFDINISDFDELDDDFEGRYIRSLRKLDSLAKHYTIRDFSSEVLNLRKSSENGIIDLDKLNSSCVKMIATEKQLYN